jgi:GMP synthase (glutamine-hydrolysing)
MKNLKYSKKAQRIYGFGTMKSAVVIRHLCFEDLGTLADSLTQHGYSIKYVEAGIDAIGSISPLEPDLLVVLGGPIGVYDEVEYPFLIDEIKLLQARLSADLPTLGICLGAQLMAKALGAKVYAGNGKEIGWLPIWLSAVGAESSLKHLRAGGSQVLHWHGDTFDLPAGAQHLAASNQYQNQAFAWQDCGLALQFHPEVTALGLERWFIGHAGEISTTPGINVTQLRQDARIYGEQLAINASKMWDDWLLRVENCMKDRNKI